MFCNDFFIIYSIELQHGGHSIRVYCPDTSTCIQKVFPNRNGEIPGPFPPCICGYQFRRWSILQKFQYLHKFFFDGHHRDLYQARIQVLKHLKVQRKLTQYVSSACHALGIVLCALTFSGTCKYNNTFFLNLLYRFTRVRI